MPDVFVPIDTSDRNNGFLIAVLNMGLVSQYSYDYVDNNRQSLSKYKEFSDFDKQFQVTDDAYMKFVSYAKSKSIQPPDTEVKAAAPYLKSQLRAYISRQLYRNDGFFPILLREDLGYKKALEVISDPDIL